MYRLHRADILAVLDVIAAHTNRYVILLIFNAREQGTGIPTVYLQNLEYSCHGSINLAVERHSVICLPVATSPSDVTRVR